VRARIFLTVGLLWLSLLPGAAQNAAAAPDFTEGFTKLAALGLPALDPTAKWVTSRDDRLPYELTRAAKSLKGNAWLLPAVDGKPQLLPLGGVTPTAGKPSATSPDLAKDVGVIIAAINKSANQSDEDSSDALLNNRYSSSTIDADLLLFATQLHQTGHADLANQLAFAIFNAVPSREAVVDAAIDKFAGALYEQATADFFKSADWAAYEKSLTDLTRRFPRGWSGREAVALFLPQVAKQAAGLKPPAPTLPDTPLDPRALALLSELTEPPKPAAAKTTPASTQEALLRARMMEMSDYYNTYGGRDSSFRPLWLLDPPADPKPDAPALGRLTALKMAALPALAALLGDPFLTHSPNGSSYSSRSYFSSNESAEEILYRKYQSLHRPSTRGELAKQLLLATLPEAEDSSGSPDDETLRLQALEFWKAHQSATREELAAVFLREGSRSQIAQAARLLATATDPQSHQIFEGHVLGLDPALGAYQEVQIYLRTRKTAGKPFFDAYAKLVRSQTPADAHLDESSHDETSWLLRQSGGVEKLLNSLGSMVSPLPPRTLAVQIAKGKPADAREAINSLRPLMADLSPTKQLHAYLEGANAATDAAVRARFLMASLDIEWDEDESEEPAEPAADRENAEDGEDGEDAEPAPPPVRKVSEPEAKVWRKLLADQRALPKDIGLSRQFYYFSQNEPLNLTQLAELAAFAFESSVSSESFYGIFQAAPILGKPLLVIVKETAMARLAGQPVAPLPDADKVSEERLAAIVAEAGAKPPAEIHPYLKTLTPDERAAWRDWLNDPEDLPLPDSVKTLRTTVISKFPGSDDLQAPAKYTSSLDLGFQFSPDNVLQYLESLAPKIAGFSPYIIATSPASFGPGLQIAEVIVPLTEPPAKPEPPKAADEATADDEEDPDADESEEDDPMQQWRRTFMELQTLLTNNPAATAAITINARGRRDGSPVAGTLALTLGPDGKLSTPKDPDAEEPTPSIQESLERLLNPSEPAAVYLRILTRAHADILFKDATDEDSNLLPSP
jgi:hypothetical protein